MDNRKHKNIILDFMDPENRILYGTYTNYPPDKHIATLSHSLNFAVLLCGEYCILPPCSIMQCQYARRALKDKSAFLDNGLIKFPVREKSLNDFFAKKKRNYEQDKEDEEYAEFFAEGGPTFLFDHATEIIKRETKVGEAVAQMVMATPFDDPLWSGLKTCFGEKTEELRNAPAEILRGGEAISVKSIKRFLNLDCDEDVDFQIGRILQNKYFNIYIYEYDARIIHGIPPKTTDFFMLHDNNAYEFAYIRHVFSLFRIYELVSAADADFIIRMRQSASYYDFINAVIGIGESSKTVDDAKKTVSRIFENSKPSMHFIPFSANFNELSEEAKDSYLGCMSDNFALFVKSYGENERIRNYSAQTSAPIVDNGYIDSLKLKLLACDMTKPFVFIGYNRADCERQVYEDCILLGKMGVNYWIDNANMRGTKPDSEGWKSVIVEALSKCSVYIPYISPNFFDSAACGSEVIDFFGTNKDADILLIIKEGLSTDAIIRKILTYHNILQGDISANMIKLFKASALSTGKLSVEQSYRVFRPPYFEHYINDSIFFNTFKNKTILENRYNDFTEWSKNGYQLLKEELL